MKLSILSVVLCIIILGSCSLKTSPKKGAKATFSTRVIPNIEPIAFPSYSFTLLSVDNENGLLVSTTRSSVYAYNGTSFTKIFDKSALGNREVYGLFQDEQRNVYVSPSYKGAVWRSTNYGETWTRPLNMSAHGGGPGGTAPKPHWCGFGNGTILVGQWVHMGPYIYRSDNWGVTWSLWKNFTAIFPEYTSEDPYSKPAYWIRHIHGVFHFPTESALFVSLGDLIHSLYKSTDGGTTWTMAYPHGFTSHIALSDRVLLGADGDVPLMLYRSQNFKAVWKPKGKNASYPSTNIFRSFVYDKSNDVLYVGVGTYPAPAHRSYYTAILASTDQGHTWTPIITLDTSPTKNRYAPDLALCGGYIYYSWNGVLKRFGRLSQAEVSYIHNQDSLTKTVVDKTHISCSTKILKNPELTINQASLTNLLINPSFENWDTPPVGWSEPGALWNGKITYTNGTGFHGGNSYRLVLGGNGTIWVSTSPALYLTKGFYTLRAYVKANASYPLASAYIVTNEHYVSPSGYRLTDYLVDTWRITESQFYLETDKTQSVLLRVDVPSGYVINATIEWDALILYKHPAYYGSEAPFYTENFDIPYTTTSVTTANGSLIIGNQTVMFTTDELPKTVSLGDYLVGIVPVQLLNGNIADLTISGEVILEVSNATLERKGAGLLYIGKMYTGFSVIDNSENALLAFHDPPLCITSGALHSRVLSITVSDVPEANRTAKICCGEMGEPLAVYQTGEALTWNYDASTTILALNIMHTNSERVLVYWRPPGDVNVDHVVDIFDIGEISAHWYPGPPIGPMGYDAKADINGDGAVDIFDIGIVSSCWGESW
ncbi:MAG: dockerin type I domain-containing protein [Candidatus Bathyarchaeota archaeon]